MSTDTMMTTPATPAAAPGHSRLFLPAINGGPFHCRPAEWIQLEDEAILANDPILPHDMPHPHGMKLWVIGHEFGPIVAIWANHEQDAMDEGIDQGKLDCLLVEDPDPEDEDLVRLGGAGELCDLAHAWIRPVRLDPREDCELVARFAEARGGCLEDLSEV